MIDCRPSLIRILCVWELRAVSISTRLLLVSRNVIERFITLLVRKNPLLLIVKAITVAFRIICRSVSELFGVVRSFFAIQAREYLVTKITAISRRNQELTSQAECLALSMKEHSSLSVIRLEVLFRRSCSKLPFSSKVRIAGLPSVPTSNSSRGLSLKPLTSRNALSPAFQKRFPSHSPQWRDRKNLKSFSHQCKTRDAKRMFQGGMRSMVAAHAVYAPPRRC